MMPWEEVHCNSIGPWKIELRACTLTFHTMTMIDSCTNLVEIKRTKSTTAKEEADKLKSTVDSPYKIVQVHTNGMVTIRLSSNVTEE